MIARCLAGTLLGFPLAALLLALLLHMLPNHGDAFLIPALILFFPLWTVFMAAAYMFRSGLRAWLMMGSANVTVFAVLWLLRLPG
ncbi:MULTISPECIES: hypothetical protein [unclassified Dyella]|uniref:hypothetical protein n=1 Tax=unclassified Dyella TaxID=2634549 RepID=UPI000C83B85F|nr:MULTISPECIES: hypothetical protein [unclassified Dyella]MDR3446776.1 hypothetical protein [Dyella sp.]PMQ03187.1 hypothetical protein DyAD56_20915 [Dyella sp. AD56]